MNLYTIVTNDAYEFPVKSDIRVGEAASFLHTTKGNVRNMVLKPRKKSKYKVIVTGKVEFDRVKYARRYYVPHDRTEYFRQMYLKKKEQENNNAGSGR